MSIPYVKEAGAVVLLAVLAWGGHWLYQAGANSERARAERIIGEFAKAEAKAQADARKAEQEKAAAVAGITKKYEQDKVDAKAAADRTVADLRAGTVRLRNLWQAERATDGLSDAATAARHADEIARLRQEAAGRIIGIGEEADAQVRGLQAVVRADRE